MNAKSDADRTQDARVAAFHEASSSAKHPDGRPASDWHRLEDHQVAAGLAAADRIAEPQPDAAEIEHDRKVVAAFADEAPRMLGSTTDGEAQGIIAYWAERGLDAAARASVPAPTSAEFAVRCPTCNARAAGAGYACDCEGKHYPPGRWTSAVPAPTGPHEQIETPGWDTKLRCACGFEAATKRELTLHFDASAVPAPTPDADAFKIDALNGALSLCQSERDEAREQAGQLAAALRALDDALLRTEANLRKSVEGKPVRDMTENIAENVSASRNARAVLASFDASTKGTTDD